MPYPDNFSSAALDAAMGRDDDDGDYVAEDCYAAAVDLLNAFDRGWIKMDRGIGFIIALRAAVESERVARAADEEARRAAIAKLSAMKGAA